MWYFYLSERSEFFFQVVGEVKGSAFHRNTIINKEADFATIQPCLKFKSKIFVGKYFVPLEETLR